MECYVNRCYGEVTVPADAEPGLHTVSVEGGAPIVIEVTGDPPE